ncbi:hypothetical protein EZV62_006835 [Acer yangbiense]|uniref:Pentatricopeptide repeat-containing protein n=1 Tax=Acer yangbiense TaxID=1000413 RepID=A0A5C7I885_9ROSI|nr:hypothetical protein EZV62_006835 [Acer yangbiense]
MKSGLKVFDEIPKWNVVVWTSLISGYVNNDCASEAIRVFKDMESLNVEPNEITLVHVLVACARSRDLSTGKLVHSRVHQLGYDPFVSSCNPNLVLATATFDMGFGFGTKFSCLCNEMNIRKDVAIGTALDDMYAKSGDAESARKVFSELKMKDTMAWTSMIIGLAMHGHGEEALRTFKRMREDATVSPDQITYIGVLCACSHVGLFEEGQRHFTEMINVYGIEPTIEHYGCMVDLLSQAGCFEEAERLVEQMPIQPNIAVWGALLNGCEIYGNVDLADQVRSHIREVEITVGSGVYVLLSNIYMLELILGLKVMVVDATAVAEVNGEDKLLKINTSEILSKTTLSDLVEKIAAAYKLHSEVVTNSVS